MQRLFNRRDVWVGILSNRLRAFRIPFCTKPNNNKVDDGSLSRLEAYQQLENLDFMTAAKIVLNAPKRKFGIDFHLVQLFFACMPSLAVYLVAKYAHYEMRRMEAELEVKKKAEEEAKEKELLLLKVSEEKESGSDPELQEVKARLGKLEEAINEIVVIGSKKQPASTVTQKEDGIKQPAATAPEVSNSSPEDPTIKETKKGGSVAVTDASQQNQNATQDKGP